MCRHWNKITVERKPFGRMETPIKVEAAVDPSANMRTRIPMQVSCCGQENALNGMIIQETSPKVVSFCFSAETRPTTPEDPTLNPGPTEVNAVKNTNGFREEVDQRAAPSATETAADNTERDSNRRLKEILLRQRAFLEEHLDPDSDLLNIFLSKRILNRPQIAEVKAKETFYQRNAEILNFISKNQKEKEFVDALKVSNQEHLANFIGNDGAYDNRFGGKWPLGEKELDILDDNQSALVDLLDPEELLNHLFSKEIVNKRQMESIRSKTTSYDKNETILEILRRRSLEDYENTIECLDACNQQEIAEILRNNGVLAEFHANMELSSGSVNEQEAIIVENFVELLKSKSPKDRQRIQELVDRRLVGTAVGQSVVNYFFCRSLEDLESIRLSFESGSLRRSIETVYGRLMHDQEILKLRLTWNEDNYEKCHSYFGVSLPRVLRLRRQLINVMAWGVAKFDDHLYVLCREPKHSVRVFRIHDERREKKKKEKNDRSFSAVGEIPLNETKLPVDMAADASARLLFVADSNSGCVWRVTVDDHRVDRWLTNTGSPFTISVCSDGCLLMARWGSPSTLETYSSSSAADAPRLRDTVRLPLDIVHPLHSVETSTGNFVVIHTWKPNGEKGVSEVSRSGEILHRFQSPVDSSSDSDPSSSGGPEVVRLMDPRHVTRDSSDRVLVADYRGHCVLVFSRDLKTCHRLLLSTGGGEEGIQLPRRLHHDAIGNEVIVAQHGGRQDVLLFGLSCSPEADAVEVFDGNCEKQNRDEEQSRVLNDQEFEKATETVASETTMNDVLFEILDIILQKCLLRRFLKGDGRQTDDQRDDQRLLSGVMAVSELWRRRIIRKRFKTQLMRVLTRLYGLSRKREAIVRNACPYLLETVRPKSSLPRLRSVGCLTDGEIRSATRAKDEAKRAAASVEIIRRRRPTVDEDERRYASLVRCLRRTGQRQAANVLETGGVCIRVDVKRNAIEQSLREFLEKKQSLSRRWQRFGQQLNDLHMELINVDRDKDETLWILYKQKENYQQPRELPLDRLTNLIATVTTKGRSQETKKKSVNIDEAYFETERAEREMTANSLRTFDVATAVYGVTEFKGTLHFLCSDPNSLRLYGGDSYDLRREVELKEVLLPADIASSAVGNCLFVVDQSRNCVWRVDGDSYALERWSPAFEPFSLSVTEDGRVLMPRAGDPCAVETYGADASVGRVCRLPNEFADVQHAVESSNGNVVVSLLSKESKAWTICEVTETADIVRRFVPKDVDQRPDCPRRLALDAGDRVLVADYRNGRIVLLDSQLNWNGVLLSKSKDRIQDPTRIFLSADRQRLIVAQSLWSLRAVVSLFALSHR